MITMELWTGRETHALREALRMSQREFAAHLGVAIRTVAKWDSEGANVTPRGEIQRILDTALAQAETDVHNRFEYILGRSTDPEPSTSASASADAADTGQRERFLLGDGHLTIAVPKRPGERDLVATEDSVTAQHLVETAHNMQLTAGVEYIPTSGLINLNREALIVVCGPKSSPVIAAAIARDPRLGFETNSQGHWELEDRRNGQRYGSPMDEPDKPQPADVAYLGRLPRPDGAGAFLLIAGVHAIGSLGASRYLSRHLRYLHAAAEGRAFSMGADPIRVTRWGGSRGFGVWPSGVAPSVVGVVSAVVRGPRAEGGWWRWRRCGRRCRPGRMRSGRPWTRCGGGSRCWAPSWLRPRSSWCG